MEEEAGVVAPTDIKEVQQHASRRTSGIANMFFRQRESMDTDDHSRSSDRPRKGGMGGKVKPGGFGGKHKHTGSSDLSSCEPASPLACNAAADSPSAAWAAGNSYQQAEVTDTLSLSQLSPAPVATTPTTRNSAFFKFPSFKKKQHGSKGSASPGVPSSPTLPGATPAHVNSMSFSASGSSLSATGGSQSPSGAGGSGHHAGGSKLGQYSSSGDPDDAEYGSCYSDAMNSPNLTYQEAMYAGDTLDLRQAGYGMQGESPMANMRHELPEVFTPGFNELLERDCAVGREPDTPRDNTAVLEPTVALLSTAQLSQVAQMYDVQSVLLTKAADGPEGSSSSADSSTTGAAAASVQPAAAEDSGSKGQTLLEMEDIAPPAAPEAAAVQEAPLPASSAAAPPAKQHAEREVADSAQAPATAAEDVHVMLCAEEPPAAAVDVAAPAVEEEEVCAAAPAAAPAAAADNTEASAEAADTADVPAAAEPVAERAASPPPAPVEAAATAVEDAAGAAVEATPAPAAALEAAAQAADEQVHEESALTEAVTEAVEPAAVAVDSQPDAAAAAALPAKEIDSEDATAPAAADEEACEVQLEEPQQAAEAVTAAEPAPEDFTAPADATAPASAAALEAAVPVVVIAELSAEEALEVDAQRTSSPHSSRSIAGSAEPAADLAPAAEVSVDSSDSPAVAVCSSPQQDQQQEAPSTTQEPTQHQAAAAADLSAPDAAPADSTVEQPAGSSCEAAPQEPCAVSAAVEEPVGDTSTVTEAEPAPAAVLEAVSTEAVQAVEDQQQQGSVIHAPAGAADSQPQPAEACMVPEQQQVAAAAEAPAAVAAQLDSSSVPQQDACSTDVASHAIADMKSELSLAEPSSTVVGQASFLQECSGSSHQLEQQQPAPQQLPAAAPSAAAVAAPEHPPGVPVLELQQPVAPDGAEQSADVVVSSPAELQLVQEDSGLLPVEAEDFEPPLMPEASDEPVLPLGVDDDEPQQAGSPTAAVDSGAAPFSSPIMPAGPRPSPGRRRTGRTPVSMVRESIPLFLSDPSRAVGSSLMVEDSLDDQDMQQLTGGALLAGQAAAAAGAAGRLLAHGGPQRVALGFGSSQHNPLTSVAEGFVTSPIPEETSTGGSSHSRCSSRYEAAAAGSPGSSPVRQLTMAPGSSPCFGMTPGSVYSTPTLTMGQLAGVGGRHTQLGGTPASAMSSAVGSAIRDIGSAHRMGGVDCGLSPPLAGGMNVSPTLQLMPNLGAAPGMGQDTSGDGSTPSLLDARAASPSAVYNSLYTTTPFRGALAALPIDAALNAPLVDSSPFDITDDGAFEKLGMAQEAQRLAQNLAAAAAGFGTTPFPARTPAANMQRPVSPGGTALRAQLVERMTSPELTDGLRDMHEKMAIKQITALEKRVKELEGENMRLKEQVDIYEFEKTELNSQEEMEKQARLYAEEQLQEAKMALQAERQAKGELYAQLEGMRREFAGAQEDAKREHELEKQQNLALQAQLEQMQAERNQAMDRVDMLDTELTAVRADSMGLQGALQKEQQRSAEVELAMVAKDKDLADMTRINNELRGKLEKAMEQLIAAQTAKEHAREKAHEESNKAVQYYNECQNLLNERQQLLAAAEKHKSDWSALKTRYAHKSSTLKEVEQQLHAKQLEVQELMGMCDQLLQQREAQQ